MASIIDSAVVRGEIDNSVRGRGRERIWLTGRELPLLLELQGNCWRDLAGCVLCFENPKPEPICGLEALLEDQAGEVGDITASRKIRVLEVPEDVGYAMLKRGETPPSSLAPELLAEAKSELFDIRGKVLELMEEHRGRI